MDPPLGLNYLIFTQGHLEIEILISIALLRSYYSLGQVSAHSDLLAFDFQNKNSHRRQFPLPNLPHHFHLLPQLLLPKRAYRQRWGPCEGRGRRKPEICLVF